MLLTDIVLCQFFRLFPVVEAERLILAKFSAGKTNTLIIVNIVADPCSHNLSLLIQGYFLYHSGWNLRLYFSLPKVLV